MTGKVVAVVASLTLAFSLNSADASTINIDLSGAITGALIDGVGGDFAQTFNGQVVVGNDAVGAPTDPLSLAAAGSITVAAFDPGVSPAANSLLSQPGNAAPLSLLLDSLADSITWTMGSGGGGSVIVDLFSGTGAFVDTATFSGLSGYQVYSIAGLGDFKGLTFRQNTDPAGLRFMNFSYETADETPAPVPEPSTIILMGVGFAVIAMARRRRSA